MTDVVLPIAGAPSLVLRAKAGDRDAFAALVEANASDLLRLAKSILLDGYAAEDVVQDGLLAAWNALPGLRDPDSFGIWVRRIIANKARSAVGRKRHDTELSELHVADAPPDTVDLVAAIRALPPRLRAVLELYYLEGRSVEQCAYILDLPAGTVKSRLHTMRAQLRESLRER
jgi:RNA polymerase sigma factor (sigma-70 family)